MIIVTREEILVKLNAFCDKHASYADAAKRLGVTPAQLSTARNDAKRPFPARLLSRLGYYRTHVYVEKEAKKKAGKSTTAKIKKRTLRSLISDPAVPIRAKPSGAATTTKIPSLKKSFSPPFGHDSEPDRAEEEAATSVEKPTTLVDFSNN